MALAPWYQVVLPREDLRTGQPLDASEFAVHLDHIRTGNAPEDYQNPQRFFERTYLTQNLTNLATEVIRRLAGIRMETSPVFNMATQFGGGKTHALTVLYHLAQQGATANQWQGVAQLLEEAGLQKVPPTKTAVFVGTEFDSLHGRGGADGTPLRKTPWGEIAFQLGGRTAFDMVAAHDKQGVAPAGDVIRQLLPKEQGALILIDELMNYVSANRKSGLSEQLYNFMQNLSETVRSHDNAVLAVSIPASELEMNAADQADYSRFKKMLDRLGKAVVMSAEAETAEIIRRRLFEWKSLPAAAKKVAARYAKWLVDHREQLPNWFAVDHTKSEFEATYPFHPTVLSVFERKWQTLPRFQQTRGVLRLLALWVSHAYRAGYEGAQREPLIGLGSAPFDDSLFRSAVFEQLGENKLAAAVETDICGKPNSFALRLDEGAEKAIKQARLHRKSATVIFFESNGGQQAHTEASVPEIRLAVAEPSLQIGNVETVLETLGASCYYLTVERNKYRFSLTPNLNKLLADRRASIQPLQIDERVRAAITTVFTTKNAQLKPILFPENSKQIPDRPVLTFVVASLDHCLRERAETEHWVETLTKTYGTAPRTFKSALVWCLPENPIALQEEARKTLAWEVIQSEEASKLDESQRQQLHENLNKSQRDLKEAVWRSYKAVMLLEKDDTIRSEDLGLLHSSAAETPLQFMLNHLRQTDKISDQISPNFLIRNWPPAFRPAWNTKSVRDAFFAAPQFPKLLNAEVIKDTIARGASEGLFAYVGKQGSDYDPFLYQKKLDPSSIEISEEMFILSKAAAEHYIHSQAGGVEELTPEHAPSVPPTPGPPPPADSPVSNPLPPTIPAATHLTWHGDVPAQKWILFYQKMLAKFASGSTVKLTLTVDIFSEAGISSQKIEEAQAALRELGLADHIEEES